MLSSKDILERTGISRATLNNYIAAGLVGRPDVLPPEPQDGGAPRIGYFPEETVDRIETIQRLKREGWSLGRILEFFATGGAEPIPSRPTAAPYAGTSVQGSGPQSVQPTVQSSVQLSVQAPSASVQAGIPPDTGAAQLLVVAVLAVNLHDAEGLWVTLSVQDYFDLVNDVASELRRLVSERRGHAVRLAPHRFLCHFLPGRTADGQFWSALEAGQFVRDAIREVSARWKLRRGWDVEIYADAGVAEGEAWVDAGGADELQVVGDVTADASHLARASRRNAVLVTRDLIARLPTDQRQRVAYAAPGVGQVEGAPQRPGAFTRLRDISPARGLARRLADLPVTELVTLRTGTQEEWKDPV